MNDDNPDLLRAKINGETSRMAWKELERFFAAGSVIAVDAALDLVEVAQRIASDDKRAVAQWMETGQVGRVSDAQAMAWHDADAELWAVVVKPWILVQDKPRS
ncbi:DUF2288 domain-containing protein [Noviherbaspirillum galbum]|uniref:DUF2288 domain-containing protein n=1 Tax=Noviherbaspirillum galbum TaxID=2709383 RepID=A0A6B3SWT2_9BURK|nr:DUF2288 domain-containing protein [Noviherbaspirillum galbum]NEX63466.1 DUF2288 domain-containing protein [Noviherbaspirillum galbum]